MTTDFDLALGHHQAGRLAEAERHYRAVLEAEPDNAVTIHNLGVIDLQQGRPDAALLQFARTIALAPGYRAAHINSGHAHMALQRAGEAAACFRRAAELDGTDAGLWFHLGMAAKAAGQPDEAAEAFGQAASLKPDWGEAFRQRGAVLRTLGRKAEALAYMEQAAKLAPDDVSAINSLALALAEEGRRDEAAGLFRRALSIAPGVPELYCNLGVLERDRGDVGAATRVLLTGAALAPDSAEIQNNLGLALAAAGRFDEALAAYDRSLGLGGRSAGTLANRASSLRELDRPSEALAAYLEANAIDHRIGVSQIELLRRSLCDWNDYPAGKARLDGALAQNEGEISPFSILASDTTPDQQLACARAWSAKRYAKRPRPGARAADGRRLRLGYLSGDFRRHAVAYLLVGLLERHDHAKFELFGYSYGADDHSDLRKRLVASFDHFSDIAQDSHERAAEKISADGVDILVDLGGYTAKARPDILALRPAALQVSYLGFPGSMGADFIDGVIADPYLAPNGCDSAYTERVIRLPDVYQPSDPSRRPATLTRDACGLAEDALVLCCFNNSYKINPPLFDAWARILKAAPKAVLWLSIADPAARCNLRREAAARGIEQDRIAFTDLVPFDQYLGQMALADLFLDCFPYNAGATANDALWVGLPLLTCSGATYVSRMAGSLLTAAGLPELITRNLPEYEARAIELLSSPAKLPALRQKLATARKSSPLFDMNRYARAFEAALIDMLADNIQA